MPFLIRVRVTAVRTACHNFKDNQSSGRLRNRVDGIGLELERYTMQPIFFNATTYSYNIYRR